MSVVWIVVITAVLFVGAVVVYLLLTRKAPEEPMPDTSRVLNDIEQNHGKLSDPYDL